MPGELGRKNKESKVTTQGSRKAANLLFVTLQVADITGARIRTKAGGFALSTTTGRLDLLVRATGAIP